MSTFGRIRSSQRGNHQARWSRTAISAGMRVIRTRKASMRMPAAKARPIDLMIGSCGRMNPENTEIMMSPAAVTTRALCRKPSRTASRGVAPWLTSSCIRETGTPGSPSPARRSRR